MRIHYDHQVFSLQNAGGASRYQYELLRYLSAIPDVHASLFLGLHNIAYPFPQLRGVRGLRTSFPPGSLRYAVNEAMESAACLAAGRYDIYHPTYFRRMPVIRTRRVVTTYHDSTYEEFPEFFPDAASVMLYKTRLYAEADRVICISEYARRGLLQFYPVRPDQVCVVHHGLSPLPRSELAARELKSRTRRDFLLYVGARNAHKNFPAFLEAFRAAGLAESYDLLCLGGGPLSVAETASLRSFSLQDSVLCLPSVTDDLLGEAYATAALFVYPSLSEGFGMPPLEAMAAGCPVAASDVTAIPEICANAPFYFDPRDPASIAAVLVKAVDDQTARRQVIQRGYEVAARYSWEKCGAQTLAVYRESL